MNLVTTSFLYFGSGTISRFSARWRRDILSSLSVSRAGHQAERAGGRARLALAVGIGDGRVLVGGTRDTETIAPADIEDRALVADPHHDRAALAALDQRALLGLLP